MVAETSFEGIAPLPPAIKARMDTETAKGKSNLLYIFIGIWCIIALIIYFTTPGIDLPGKVFIVLFFAAFLGAGYLLVSRQGGANYTFCTRLAIKDLKGAEGKCITFIFEDGSRKKEFGLALAGALSPEQMLLDTAQHVAEYLTDQEKLKRDPNVINYNYKYALEFQETPSGVLATFTEAQASSNRRRTSYILMSNSALLLDRQTAERLRKLINDDGIVVKITDRKA